MRWFVPAVALLATVSAKNNKIQGCYWSSWSYYRLGDGTFDVADIDTSLCTHGFYGFALLSNKTWSLEAFDPWLDLSPADCGEETPVNCNYDTWRRFTALASDDFIPILSVGGWRAGSEDYSEMAADPNKRQSFVDSVVPTLKKYGFQGLDFDWEYPGSRDGSDPEHDKDNFSELIEMLGEVLHAEGMILTAALSPGWSTIDTAYDVPRISKVFDIMNVMTYDYHGWWKDHNFTGHNAPLHSRKEELPEDHPGYLFNVVDTIEYFYNLGAPYEKMAMGIPLYGRGFKLVDDYKENEKGLYCPADAGIPMGPYTAQDGIWGYNEIMQAFNNDTLINLPDAEPKNWTITVDDCYKAPYASNGPYWIGYDNEESVAIKTKFANFKKLAGTFVWSIESDDFSAIYHDEKFPLLKSINRELAEGNTLDPNNPACVGTAPMCDGSDPTPPETDCEEHGEIHGKPNDCHMYYMCLEQDNGSWEVKEFDCGEWAFDPSTESCVDPGLPGNELLCGE